ncbi:DEP domain-containing mTOR-interacting protein [Liparis tanakae]|uniref:DEP domain-containing mTOR-interacting protein n=1 Tax=Liparis tanakae TaxID=230148 RepID=A0A4Z2HQR7_9TELE|nr:DEP domain-containing mTOR-interacting protein [Liparis tanakae]
MERTSSIRRKAVARQSEGEVMIAGEQLRLRLHDGKLIKDRRYHLRTYPNCFVAEELIDWLVSHKEAPDRATAVCLMQHLMDHDILHHVCDKRPVLKDAKLLYRFRKDDGTFPFNREVKIFMRGQRLHEHLIGDKKSILQLREEHGVAYQRSFAGCQLIDWLLQNGEAESRCRGLELCRALQEHGIIQHVAKKHDFSDSGLLYQFCINFRRRRRLSELLKVIGDTMGWGFVVRGMAPCYVQAVDPGSPSAAAGVKVRQFVCQVNGQSVLHLDYRTVNTLVMTGPRTVVLEVLEPLE